MKNTEISMVANARSTRCETVSFERAIADIQSGKWKQEIDKIRSKHYKGQDVSADKKRLRGHLFSGVFKKRAAAGLKQHSGLLCLDFDDLDGQVDQIKCRLCGDKHALALWISPSGNGIKLIVRIPPHASHHKAYFLHAAKYFHEKYKIEADPSGKDVSRLCFVSYDPDLYQNTNAVEFFLPDSKSSEALDSSPEKTEKPSQDLRLKLISADQRLDELLESDPAYRDLWNIHVARYFEGGPQKRNAFISEVVPRLFYRFSPDMIRKFSEIYWEAYKNLFKDNLMQHKQETDKMIKSLIDGYENKLLPVEMEVYQVLPENQKCAFRIIRDLAQHPKKGDTANGRFFLPCNELRKRLGLLYDNEAWRILRQLERYGLIKELKRGKPRSRGNNGEATEYQWILTDVSP